MSIKVSITNAEIDVLNDLLDGDSCQSPEDLRYPTLMGFLMKVTIADKRPRTPERDEAAIQRNIDSVG
jgi:hypothetical protein